MDFNSRLDEAIKINVFGTLKMFELAQQTKHLDNFLHISTAYVNSDKKGVIQEKIYDINIDAEEYIHSLLKKPINEVYSFLHNLTSSLYKKHQKFWGSSQILTHSQKECAREFYKRKEET